MLRLQKSPLFVCSTPERSQLLQAVSEAHWSVLSVSDAIAEDPFDVAVLEILPGDDVFELRQRFPHAVVAMATTDPAVMVEGVDFCFDPSKHAAFLDQVLAHATAFWRKNNKVLELVRDVAMRRQRMHQLNEISLALTGSMSQHELLETILSEARRIAGCEAGSLYLIEGRGSDDGALVFKLAQNDRVEFSAEEARLPLSTSSIAGYVAVTGKELNIQDVYRLETDLPYQFNPSFDERYGYRSQSILALPMSDHRGEVVGVLQFLNKVNEYDGVVVPFSEETVEVLRAIASQAAMSLQKNALLEDINQLFESFVQASVKAVEQRDPTTSGHSFRVAETTVALLHALPASGLARFRQLDLTPDHIREVRYAALLHDFGKVGVPEAVLVKPNKLSDERLEIIRYRIELQKERLRHGTVQEELHALHHGDVDIEQTRARLHTQLTRKISVLDQYLEWVEQANSPNVLSGGDYSHLEEIRRTAFKEFDGSIGGVITAEDLNALSVRRGSLTAHERKQIEQHVVYTTEFLSVLPWPPELKDVPRIAGAHHERLDGTGYPLGLTESEIPLASRVMAVCDVYDALTAMDRPYKPAMSQEVAFNILNEEAQRGLLDADMVQIFIASESYSFAKAV